jgi:hypothetical protein
LSRDLDDFYAQNWTNPHHDIEGYKKEASNQTLKNKQ